MTESGQMHPASTLPSVQETEEPRSPQTPKEAPCEFFPNQLDSAPAAGCEGAASSDIFTPSMADHIADRIADRTLAVLREVLPELCSQQSKLMLERLYEILQTSTVPSRLSLRRKSDNLSSAPVRYSSAHSVCSAGSNQSCAVLASAEKAELAASECGSVGTASCASTRSKQEVHIAQSDKCHDKASRWSGNKCSSSSPRLKRMTSMRSTASKASRTSKPHSYGQSERSRADSIVTVSREGGGGWGVKELEFNLMSSYLEGVVGMPHTSLKRSESRISSRGISRPERGALQRGSGIAFRWVRPIVSWWRKGHTKAICKDPWTDSAQNLGPSSSASCEGESGIPRMKSDKSERSERSVHGHWALAMNTPGNHKSDSPPSSPRLCRTEQGQDQFKPPNATISSSPSARSSGVMDLIAQHTGKITAGVGPVAEAHGESEQTESERELDSPQLGLSPKAAELDFNTRSSEPTRNSTSWEPPVQQARYHSESSPGPSPGTPRDSSRATLDGSFSGQLQHHGTIGDRDAYTLIRGSATFQNQGPLLREQATSSTNMTSADSEAHLRTNAPGVANSSLTLEARASGVSGPSPIYESTVIAVPDQTGHLLAHRTQDTHPHHHHMSHIPSMASSNYPGTSIGHMPSMASSNHAGLAPSPSMTSSSRLRHWRTSQIVHYVDTTDSMWGNFSPQPSKSRYDDEEEEVYIDETAQTQDQRAISALEISGIIPWQNVESRCFTIFYQWTVLLLATLSLGACVEQTITTRLEVLLGSLCYSSTCLKLGLLSDIPLALGSLFGLVSLGVHRQSGALVQGLQMLSCYAARTGFHEKWSGLAKRDLTVSCVIWVIATLERARGSGLLEAIIDGKLVDPWGALQVAAFAVSSAVVLMLTFCVLYVCRALMTMIDTYCCEMIHSTDLNKAVVKWNIVQAFLRQSSFTIECCFFVLQTTALSCCSLGIADVVLLMRQGDGGLETLLPAVLVTLGIARIFFSAASVTDECAHVPSLVNSLSFGQEEMDLERQYVVNYIIHSAAGFYVFEVRLTSAMSLKFAYFCAVAGFTLTTTILSDV